MSDSKNKKPVTMMEIFLIQVILVIMFIILPINSVKLSLIAKANRDVANLEKIIVNINSHEKISKLDKLDFNSLYDKKLIPEDMLMVNPKDKSYIAVNGFGNQIHFSSNGKNLKAISTTYSKTYCYKYLKSFVEQKAKEIKINGILIKENTLMENYDCKSGLNLLEIIL